MAASPTKYSFSERINNATLAVTFGGPVALIGYLILTNMALDTSHGQIEKIMSRCVGPSRKAYGTDVGFGWPLNAVDDRVCVADHFFRLAVSTEMGKGALLAVTSLFFPIGAVALFESGSPGVSRLLGPWSWFFTLAAGLYAGLGPLTTMFFLPVYLFARLTSHRTLATPSTPPSLVYLFFIAFHAFWVLSIMSAMVIYPYFYSGNIGSLATSDESKIFGDEAKLPFVGVGWREIFLSFAYAPLTLVPLILWRAVLYLGAIDIDTTLPRFPKDDPFPFPPHVASALWLAGFAFIGKGLAAFEWFHDDALWFLAFDGVAVGVALFIMWFMEANAFDVDLKRGAKPSWRYEYLLIGGPGALFAQWVKDSKQYGLKKLKEGQKVE